MAEIYESKTQIKNDWSMEERIADFLGIDKATGKGGTLRLTLEHNMATVEWSGFVIVTGDKLTELLKIIQEEAR